jgi:hypothetical protein
MDRLQAVPKRRLIIAHEKKGKLSCKPRVGYDPVVFIRKQIVDDLFRALRSARNIIAIESPTDTLLSVIDEALNQYPFYEIE